MTYKSSTKDPRQLPVQLNVTLPWAFREYLRKQADTQKTSLNRIAVEALEARYLRGFNADEMLNARRSTTEAGATS